MGFTQIFESRNESPNTSDKLVRNFRRFSIKRATYSDRKESGNAEGCESTGRIAVFRVSSRDDGPVALAEAGSVIWVGPSYAGDDQPFDLDVLFRSPHSPPCPPVSLSQALVLSSFLHSTPVTHWKIYRGCCLYPAKIHPPRDAQNRRRRRCISPSDSNWHIIRRKFSRAFSTFCCFIRLLRLLFSCSAAVTAISIAIDVFILVSFSYTYLFVLFIVLVVH